MIRFLNPSSLVLLAVLTGLAAKNPENSQLILQTEGSSYIRNDVLRDQPVVLLRYGKRSIYWINTVLVFC